MPSHASFRFFAHLSANPAGWRSALYGACSIAKSCIIESSQ